MDYAHACQSGWPEFFSGNDDLLQRCKVDGNGHGCDTRVFFLSRQPSGSRDPVERLRFYIKQKESWQQVQGPGIGLVPTAGKGQAVGLVQVWDWYRAGTHSG